MLNQINYILLDAARMGETIEKAKEINPDYDSLYRGRSEEDLAVVAPYLFLFKQNTDFATWYMETGWGDAWGILIRSYLPMPDLHRHFRKFLIVGTEDNQELYFRFYDPRVLRIFLPTCDQQQLREFFGPIEYFIMEDEDKNWAIRCWLENGHLRSVKIPVEELINNTFKFPGKTESVVEETPITQEVDTNPWQPRNEKPKKSASDDSNWQPDFEAMKNKRTPRENYSEPTPEVKPPTEPKPEEKKSKWDDFFFD